METVEDYDHLKCRDQPKIVALVDNRKYQTFMLTLCLEPIYFSDKVDKINQNDWTQTRTLVISKDKIYNIHKNKIKRDMQISELGGVTKNNHEKTKEFAIHFPETYDYRFKVSDEKRN